MSKPKNNPAASEIRVDWEDLSRAIELHLEKNYTVSWHRDRFGGRFYVSTDGDRALTILFESLRPQTGS